MAQFKRCYCIIWPSSCNCAKQIIHKKCCYIPSMEHQMVGYFAKFTSLVLATCLCGIAKSTFPYFTEFHLHFAKFCHFCLIVRVNTTQFLVLYTCIMLTYHSTTASTRFQCRKINLF